KIVKHREYDKEFAKSMEDGQKKLIKDLMSDPDYKKKMLDFMKDREMTDQMMQLLKSQEFSEHLQKSIQKTFENPIFQAKIQEILLKAAEEQGQGGQKQEG